MTSRLDEFRADLTGREQFVLIIVALSPLAWAPVFVSDSTPRVALALALLPLGVIVLLGDALKEDLASRLALLFVAIALTSSAVSPAPGNSLLGTLDWWVGSLGLSTAVAWWAVGRTLGPRSRELLLPALTIGALWNGAVALAQVTLEIDTGVLASNSARGSGTMLNPVYYGAFAAGVLACWLMRLHRGWRAAVVVLALAISTGLSGGRVAAGAVLLVAATALMVRGRARTAVVNAGLVVGGLAVASLIAARSQDAPGVAGVAGRALERRGGSVRLAIWRAAVDAFKDRPFLGWGPGNIEIATERQFDLEYTRQRLTAGGGLLRWTDTHNVGLNLLVSVGAAGVLVVAALLFASLRPMRRIIDDATDRSLLAGVAAIAINWMLQPWTVHTLPIAMVLFGAATHASRSISDPPGRALPTEVLEAPRWFRPAMLSGVLVGVLLLSNLFVLDRALHHDRLDLADKVASVGYRDPFLDREVANAFWLAILDRDRSQMLERAAWYARRSASTYPAHVSYGRVGEIAFAQGDTEAAWAAEHDALAVQPWNPITNRRLLVLSVSVGDEEQFRESMSVLCALGVEQCDPDAVPAKGDVAFAP